MEIDILRVLFAFLGGYFLSLAGSLSQVTTNNQIASPSTLGMDGLGVLCVLIAHFVNLFFVTSVGLEVGSFSLFCLFFVVYFFLQHFIFKKKKKELRILPEMSMKKVILLGLTFNLFIGAFFSTIQFVCMALNFDFPSALWFGSFKYVEPNWLWIFIPSFIFCLSRSLTLSSDLEKLNLGSSFARGLEVDIEKVQKNSLGISLFLTVLVISFFGVFSFLGLIFPHILRSFSFFSKSIRRELIIGPIISGCSLLLIDFLCFNLTYEGAELPVGMASGVLGSFFLIYLIYRNRI